MGKKLLKFFIGVVAVIALVIGGGAAFISLDWPVKAPLQTIDIKVEPTPERLARGRSLVSIRCAGCHYDQATGGLTGHVLTDAPKEFGTFYAHNITQHPTKGLGRYTDGELIYLLRTGIRRDGVFTGPFMQSPFLSDEDLYSIVAFLRSDDPWTRAQDVDDREAEPSFLAKLLMHVAFRPAPMPAGPIATPALSDKVAYGRYVAQAVADCFVCHSADFKTLDSEHPEQSAGYFGGGNKTLDATGREVPTANLTMDPKTGIGAWSEADFITAVRHGMRPDGKPLRFPMFRYFELSDEEVGAVFAYLKTVPVIVNEVPRNFDQFQVASSSEGEKLYNKYGCFSCHGQQGVGVCDLTHASKTYHSDDELISFIKAPSSFVRDTKMPTWQGIIPEAEYPALVAHVRQLERAAVRPPSGSAGH